MSPALADVERDLLELVGRQEPLVRNDVAERRKRGREKGRGRHVGSP